MSNNSWVHLLAEIKYLNSWLRVKTVAQTSLLFLFKKSKINSYNMFWQSCHPDHKSLLNYFRLLQCGQAVLIDLTKVVHWFFSKYIFYYIICAFVSYLRNLFFHEWHQDIFAYYFAETLYFSYIFKCPISPLTDCVDCEIRIQFHYNPLWIMRISSTFYGLLLFPSWLKMLPRDRSYYYIWVNCCCCRFGFS